MAADPPTDTDPLDGEDMGTAVAVITPRATLPNVRVTRNTGRQGYEISSYQSANEIGCEFNGQFHASMNPTIF